MTVVDRLNDLCVPVLDELGLELFDLTYEGGVVRVAVDRAGGVDLEAIAEATRRISRLFDEHDPISGSYTLEVSSPGLERTLRTPDHFRWAVGRTVAIKTTPGTPGDRRPKGTLVEADDDGLTVDLDDPAGERRSLTYDEVERATTVFVWEPTPKPGSASRSPGSSRSKAKKPTAESGPSDRPTARKDEEVEAS
ncbi:MAG: ribosome maturation factor RimP [Acidimicrobiia bacterium]|nr:ribosome maturation factor RimP [Acidimicrobiia bacterium]